jgi:hypothetical protein
MRDWIKEHWIFLQISAKVSPNQCRFLSDSCSLNILFRDTSKISTSSLLKSWMYQGLQDTWHGCCTGERSGDSYSCLGTSSWPDSLFWSWEVWPRTIQWRSKGEETSVCVFALRRGSEDLYRLVRGFVTFIAIQVVLATTEFDQLASHYIVRKCWL